MIESIRESISILDKKLLQVIQERMQLSDQVGKIKKQKNTPVKCPNTESDVLRRYRTIGSELNLSEKFCVDLASLLLEESVRIQKKS